MEDKIATAKAMGVEVGEVHHSRHDAADFVTTAYTVLAIGVEVVLHSRHDATDFGS